MVMSISSRAGYAEGLRAPLGARLGWRGSVLAVLAVSCLLAGCERPRAKTPDLPVPPDAALSTARFRKEYVLASGDQLDVLVRRVPEVSRQVVIRPDGNISLPLINDVKASGLTVPEVDAELTARFSSRLLNPEVNIIPLSVRQPMVYVAGDVTNVVAVPFREAPTAMQALAYAGGFKRSAATKDVSLIRLTDDGHIRAIPLEVQSKGQPGVYMSLRETALQPDDILFVPESKRSQVGRFIDDFINKPVNGLNSLVSSYVNFRFIQILK